jgi:hypothetical protein
MARGTGSGSSSCTPGACNGAVAAVPAWKMPASRSSQPTGLRGRWVAWVGFTSLFASVAIRYYLAQAAPTTGTLNSTTAALLDAVNALPATTTASIVFVAGHILGGILLGIALWRAIPAWAAVTLAISQPLHLVFAVFIPNHVLDGAAWAVTAVGFAASSPSPSVRIEVASYPLAG